MNMVTTTDDIALALLAKIAQTRNNMVGGDKMSWLYSRGMLDGLTFTLERMQDTEQEVELLRGIFRGWLYRYSHRLDVETRSQYKELLREAVMEYERNA